jgi:hypothetical protein
MSGFSLRNRYAVTALVVAFSGASIAILPSITASATTTTSTTTSRPKSRAHEIVFHAQKVTNTQPSPIKLGDAWVTYLSVSDAKHKKVGDGSARCSAVQATQQGVIAQCTRVLRTRHGQITLLGMDDRAGNPPWTSGAAVVGGTGRYVGLTGSASITVSPQHVLIKIQPTG